MILETVHSPSDLKALSLAECDQLAEEIRDFIVDAVRETAVISARTSASWS